MKKNHTIILLENRIKAINELLPYSNLTKEDIENLICEKNELLKSLQLHKYLISNTIKSKHISKLRKKIEKKQEKELDNQNIFFTFDKIIHNKKECLIMPIDFLSKL
jgi:hypothetical protein